MTSIIVPALCGAATGAIAYGGYKLLETLNTGHYATTPWDCPRLYNDLQTVRKSEGTPKSREVQQKQADDAKKEIERNIGRKLTPKERRQFHDHVTGQGYGYHDLVDEGIGLFGGK